MNNARIKQLRGIDSPKFVYMTIGLLAVTVLASLFGIPGTGFLAGVFLGIFVSYILRLGVGGGIHEQ